MSGLISQLLNVEMMMIVSREKVKTSSFRVGPPDMIIMNLSELTIRQLSQLSLRFQLLWWPLSIAE